MRPTSPLREHHNPSSDVSTAKAYIGAGDMRILDSDITACPSFLITSFRQDFLALSCSPWIPYPLHTPSERSPHNAKCQARCPETISPFIGGGVRPKAQNGEAFLDDRSFPLNASRFDEQFPRNGERCDSPGEAPWQVPEQAVLIKIDL